MSLIDDYERLVSSIRNLKTEIPDFEEQIVSLNKTEQAARSRIAEYELERSHKSELLIRQRLAELTDAEYNRISHAQAEVDTKIAGIKRAYDAETDEVCKRTYTDKLAKRYTLLKKIDATLQKYSMPTNVPVEITAIVQHALAVEKIKYTDHNLVELMDDVVQCSESMTSDLISSGDTLQAKFVDLLTLTSIQKSKMSDSSRLFWYVAYLTVLIGLAATIPAIPIAILGAAVCLSFRQFQAENSAMLKFILPFSRLNDGREYLKSEIDSTVDTYRKRDIAKLNEKLKTQLEPLYEQQARLKDEFSSTPQRVRSGVSDADLKSSVEEQFLAKIEACNQEIVNAQTNAARISKFIASNKKRLPALRDKQKNMLKDLSEAYLNPKNPGTSKTLTKSFFLGIDDNQGGLIEFRYDGKATLIIYKGDNGKANDCRVNKDIISMMLMQLLSSMSISMLDIYLTDTRSAGTDYAVFFRKELSDRMHLCTTKDAINDTIKILQEMLGLRTQEILTEAESIEVYNDRMLRNKSLPREYAFFFFQDPTEDQMESQAFQQLLYNGPTVGIIPIVFINHNYINELYDLHDDRVVAMQSFFQAFEGSYFVFDGASSDLTQDNSIYNVIIRNIQKGSKR